MPVYRDDAMNTGVLTGTVYPLDIDIEDQTIVAEIVTMAETDIRQDDCSVPAELSALSPTLSDREPGRAKDHHSVVVRQTRISRTRATIRRLRKTPLGR